MGTGTAGEVNAPDPAIAAAVADELARILESETFASSRRMQRFLRFIVETWASGQTSALKETSIGIAVFDREPGYDPQTDAIVRVEARRLRGKIQRYYEKAGSDDRVLIQLPVGTYIPEFIVREIAPQADPAPLPAPSPPPFAWRKWIGIAVCALGLLAAGASAGWYFSRNRSIEISQLSVVPLTSYPGQELDSQISPDGKQIAFVWDANSGQYNIYTKLLQVGNPVRVTFGSGHDLNPSWSPDGQYLAYLHVSPAEKALMVAPSLGGPARKIAALVPSEVGTWRADATQMYGSPGPAWSPTGSYIAVTDYPDARTGGALMLIAPDGGRVRQLTRPIPGVHDFSPAFSPNGKRLAFIRYTSAYTSDLFMMDVDGGVPRQLTFDHSDIRGISWLPDNRTILFASNRGHGYGMWRTSIDGDAPVEIPLNGHRITDPSVSRDGRLVAYTDTARNSNVWRVRRSNPAARFASPEMLLASSRQSFCAHYSPDGQRIGFLSDRSGSFEVWVSRADGSDPIQLTNFHGPMVGSPRWSPDGKWLAFDARRDGHAAVFIVSASGGRPRQLEQNVFEERMPSWSGDGKWVYFSSNRGGSVQLWKKPFAGGPAIRISTRIAFTSSESPDGGTVYFTGLGSGLWQVSSKGGEESAVPELRNFHAGLYFTVGKHGIYFVDQETSRNIMFLSFATRKVEPIARIERSMVIDTSSLDISPDEREIIYSQMDAGGSDIMLAQRREGPG